MLELSFLGSPIARLHGQALTLPTRKAWALLAYLACEPGMHSREKLAAMLWPDNDETSGRTALRKALGFLTGALEVEGQPLCLNTTRDAIGFNLDTSVHVDVLELQRIANETRINQANLQSLEQSLNWIHNEFLAGFTLPEAPDFEDWLEPRRESLRRDVDGVLQALASAQAEAGQPLAALATARRRVQLDTMNENAHRAVIELHLQTGDRAAALEAYRTCQQVLEKELGIAPASETEALAERARAGAARVAQVVTVFAPATSKATKPQTGMTAPFVGREREWGMLEDAWNDSLIAFVAGEPGSGKSRLMQEFMRTKKAFIALENRPGDAGVPYASLARHLRALLKSQTVTLEAWVNTELARILPECGEAPAPIQSEQGKLRFFQAIVETFQTVIRANDDLTALLYDDAQFTDTSSSEATRFVLEQLDPDARAQLRILYGYRKNELPGELEADLKQTLIAGEGVLIELEPLPASALEALLQSLLVNILPEDMAGISRTLEQFTGGNPLFVLETVKSLTESQHGEQWTAVDLETMRSENRLPKSSKVKQVIERRLERLSKPARDLVRVAAVMGQEYTLERAAKVLEADQLVLAEASEELEGMGIVRANRFTHDLIFEASYEEIPKAAKPLLHSRVLDAFEESVIAPAVLARHAIKGERWDEAFEKCLHAAEIASDMRVFREVVTHLEIASDLFFRGLLSQAELSKKNFYDQRRIETLAYWLSSAYEDVGRMETAYHFLDKMIEYAVKSQDTNFEDICRRQQLACIYIIFDFEESKKVAEELLIKFYESGSKDRIISVEFQLALLEVEKGFEESAIERLDRLNEKFNVESESSYFNCVKAMALFRIDRWEKVEFLLKQAEEISKKEGLNFRENWAMEDLSVLFRHQGKLNESIELGKKAYEIKIKLVENPAYLASGECKLSHAFQDHAEYFEAYNWSLQGASLGRDKSTSNYFKCNFLICAARNHSYLGNSEKIFDFIELCTEINESSSEKHYLEEIQVLFCHVFALQDNWDKAQCHAKKALEFSKLKFKPDFDFQFSQRIKLKILLQFGEIEAVKEDLNTRAAAIKGRKRLLMGQLHSEVVLDLFEHRPTIALEKAKQSLEIATEIGMPAERWQLESDIAHIHDQIGNQDEALAARSRATEIRDMLASWMPDETMRNTYLAFTQKQIDVPLWKWPDASTPA